MKPLDYVLIVVLAAIIGLAIYFTFRRSSSGGCCGGCGGCSGNCSGCKSERKKRDKRKKKN